MAKSSSLKVVWNKNPGALLAELGPDPSIQDVSVAAAASSQTCSGLCVVYDKDSSRADYLPLQPNPYDPVPVVPITGYGDMFRAVYDQNVNGKVDRVDAVLIQEVDQLQDKLDELSAGTALTLTATRPLSGHRVVKAVDETHMDYASSLVEDDAEKVVGIITGAVAEGDIAAVKLSGKLTEPSWNWIPNKSLFVGHDGFLTQTPPDYPDAFSMQFGTALTPTTILIQIEHPIYF